MIYNIIYLYERICIYFHKSRIESKRFKMLLKLQNIAIEFVKEMQIYLKHCESAM